MQSLVSSKQEEAQESEGTDDKLSHCLSSPSHVYAQLSEGKTITTVSKPKKDIRLVFWTSASSVDQLSLWQPFPSETSSSVLLSAAYCSFCSSRFKTVIVEREIWEVWGKKQKRMITSSASLYS